MSCDVLATGDCSVLDVPERSAGEPRTAASAGGLGYSRHYAQRIRDLGRTSKDGWIKRLWNHMFGSGSTASKKVTVKSEDAARGGNGNVLSSRRSSDHDHVDQRCLPLDSWSFGHVTETGDVRKPQQLSHCERHDVTAPRQSRSSHELTARAMPAQLINSPYLPPREKVVYYRPVLTAKPGGNARDGVMAARLRYQRLSKSSSALRSSTVNHAAASGELHKPAAVFPVRRQFRRDTATIQMEKRAKAVADRAIMVCTDLSFTCVCHY